MRPLRLRWALYSAVLAVLSSSSADAQYPGCPRDQSSGELALWRDAALAEGGARGSLVDKMDSCFGGSNVPACLSRLYQASLSELDGGIPFETESEKKIKLLPDEFKVADGVYRLYTGSGSTYKDIEQIAKERGWPWVRYKSRHSGGFDRDSSALLMIRIPGKSMSPPVDYDRYVNIALPEDPGQSFGTPAAKVSPVPLAAIPKPADLEGAGGYGFPKVFTIVAVRRPQAGGVPAKVYFNKFNRSGAAFRSEDKIPVLDSCYSCHPNGLREISPLGFNVRQAEVDGGQMMPEPMWRAVEEMNNSMKLNTSFAVVDFGTRKDGSGKDRPAVNPAGEWPIFGAIKPMNRKTVTDGAGRTKTVYPTREKEFIVGADGRSGCAFSQNEYRLTDIFGRAAGSANIYRMSATPSVRWEKVVEAMRCGSCHDNKVHGALNSKTDSATVAYKVLVDQSMPPLYHINPYANGGASAREVKDELSGDERIALMNCLKQEFELEKGFRKEWLTQVACTDHRAEPNGGVTGGTGQSPGGQLMNSSLMSPLMGGASSSGAQGDIPSQAVNQRPGNRSPAVVPNPSVSSSPAPVPGAAPGSAAGPSSGGRNAVSGQ